MNLKKLLFYGILGLVFTSCSQQKRPKLVVGIVVDQMRYDYLARFSKKFGADGFKKILKNGYSLQNAHYNYMPTVTAAGHAAIFTGTTPEYHGIISNSWYDKFAKKRIYCVDDVRYPSMGGKSKKGKSPYRMQVTTIMDQLRLAQNGHGKTIGISLKDRSAILTAGHMATAAYWFEAGKVGNFVSSAFYFQMKNELPSWVTKFNKKRKVDTYLNTTWNTFYNIKTYTESRQDNNPYEALFQGEEKPVFPHSLKEYAKRGDYEIIKHTPFGNDLLLDFAKATILGEKLGKTNDMDFLSISFSSTDIVGHQFGPYSKEIEDTYIRLDKNLADLISFLDKKIGKNSYTLFLTADHAVAPVPAFLSDAKIPAGYVFIKNLKTAIQKAVLEKFGSENLIENISNFQIFLNKEEVKKLKRSSKEIQDFLVELLLNKHDSEFRKIHRAIGAYDMSTHEFKNGLLGAMQRGYHPKFSGDVLFAYAPNFFETIREAAAVEKGTTHGTSYNYDTHVPILFYGFGIKKGITKKRYEITDIVPTLSNLLQISLPSAANGKIISEALKNE